MLKRSFLFYSLLAIILFKVNWDIIHYQRMGYLRHVYLVAGKGKDIPAGIVYYDYLRQLDPSDITAWEGLIHMYLLADDRVKARETVMLALKMMPRNSVHYPALVEMSQKIGSF